MLSVIAIPVFILVSKLWVRVICAIVWCIGPIIQPEVIPYHLLGSGFIAGLTFFVRWLVRKYGNNKAETETPDSVTPDKTSPKTPSTPRQPSPVAYQDAVTPDKTSPKTEYRNVPIGTSNPGCIVILVDQSYSMSESFNNEGTKAERATLAVNRVLEELVLACRTGEKIRERCYMTVIGYGEQVECVVEGMISDILSRVVRMEKVKKMIPDSVGGIIESEIEMPIWLEPKASGSTPMHEAFQHAAEVIERWISHKPDSFPPIVINITDGAATRPDLAGDNARKIMRMETTDGASLVFNLHIANGEQEVVFPHETTQFSGEPLAEYLFYISSALPQPLVKPAEDAGFLPELGARCFGYNMDETSMIKLLQFGSLGLTQVRVVPPPTG